MTLEIQTAELSRADQVLDAVCNNTEPDCDTQHIIAAALRAAADQVVPDVDLHVSVAAELLPKDIGAAKWSARHEARLQLLAIAAELETQS
jgi:hypothetical protein